VYSVETPDDGQQICPKHVEYFIKLIRKIVHLVGFYYKNHYGDEVRKYGFRRKCKQRVYADLSPGPGYG